MSKGSSAPARVVAVTALVCAIVVILFVVVTSLDEGGGGSGKGGGSKHQVTQGETKKGGNGNFKGAYVVQNGDTLSSIAHETGVPVSQIIELNPGVDPQILISGEKLKLR
jgi:LysM repeat protein